MSNNYPPPSRKLANARDRGLDVVRLIACILVVIMHSPMPSDSADGLFLSSLSYITAPCIGLFFMVSGALLLPVKLPMFDFLKRRFGKIIVPTLVWTAIYLCNRIYFTGTTDGIMRSICSIPFAPQGHGVLWFMYTLAGLYLIAPVISPWLANAQKREIEFILLLWAVTLCYPLLSLGLEVNTSASGILYYFTGYAGYFLLGYYMRRWPDAISWRILLPLSAISIAAPALCRLQGWHIDFYALFWYLSIFVAILCVIIYRFCCQYLNRLNVTKVARYSFGIYLCHILIMRSFLWHVPFIEQIPSYPVQTVTVAAATFTLALALSWLLSRLPYGKYITGA